MSPYVQHVNAVRCSNAGDIDWMWRYNLYAMVAAGKTNYKILTLQTLQVLGVDYEHAVRAIIWLCYDSVLCRLSTIHTL